MAEVSKPSEAPSSACGLQKAFIFWIAWQEVEVTTPALPGKTFTAPMKTVEAGSIVAMRDMGVKVVSRSTNEVGVFITDQLTECFDRWECAYGWRPLYVVAEADAPLLRGVDLDGLGVRSFAAYPPAPGFAVAATAAWIWFIVAGPRSPARARCPSGRRARTAHSNRDEEQTWGF